MEEFRNPGTDTYNGIKMLAAISGLSEAEVAWTAKRMQQLIREERLPAAEAKAIVRQEAKARPWEVRP